MKYKELKEIAKKIARLELESRKQGNNLEQVSAEINNIVDTLSLKEIFQLDEYIRQELKCL